MNPGYIESQLLRFYLSSWNRGKAIECSYCWGLIEEDDFYSLPINTPDGSVEIRLHENCRKSVLNIFDSWGPGRFGAVVHGVD